MFSVDHRHSPRAGRLSCFFMAIGPTLASPAHESSDCQLISGSSLTAIDGWPVEFKDTAGLQKTDGRGESLGIEKTVAEMELADLAGRVIDASQLNGSVDLEMIGESSVDSELMVLNKIGLVDSAAVESWEHSSGAVFTSTITGEGIEALLEAMAVRLVDALPPTGLLYPVTPGKRAVDLIVIDQLAMRLRALSHGYGR